MWISSKNSLVLKQQAILAIGMDGHCCTCLKGKWHSRQSTGCQLCIQKWTFLVNLGTKTITLFAMYTIIGTKTMSNPCHRHGWPLLYSFEGKTTQPTKRHAPISEMDFSWRIWEQKWPVFLHQGREISRW
jgi:hypothetical protein